MKVIFSFKSFRQKQQEQATLKEKILKKKEEIKKVILDAPVNENAKASLMIIEDNEILKS